MATIKLNNVSIATETAGVAALTVPSIKQTDAQNISGIKASHEMVMGKTFTLTGDLTINDNLVFANLTGGGDDITITDDGNGRTITTGSAGTLEAGELLGTVPAYTPPAGHVIKVNYHEIGNGTLTNSAFPSDNTIPQISEGAGLWSQVITPSASANYLLIQVNVKLNETSSLTNAMALALFVSDNTNALVVSQGMNERSAGGGPFNDFQSFINYRMPSWGATAKTLSLRSSGAQAYNFFDDYGGYSIANKYGNKITSSAIIWEIV